MREILRMSQDELAFLREEVRKLAHENAVLCEENTELETRYGTERDLADDFASRLRQAINLEWERGEVANAKRGQQREAVGKEREELAALKDENAELEVEINNRAGCIIELELQTEVLSTKLGVLEGVLHRAYPFTESDEDTIIAKFRELTVERNRLQVDLQAERSEVTGLRSKVTELETLLSHDAAYYQVVSDLKVAQTHLTETQAQLVSAKRDNDTLLQGFRHIPLFQEALFKYVLTKLGLT